MLGLWIERLRSNPSPHILDGMANVSGATMVEGSLAATERATETACSLISAVISSGAARIGALVSVVAMSALPIAPALVMGTDQSSPVDKANPVVEARQATPIRPFEAGDDTPEDGVERRSDHSVVDTPSIARPDAIEGSPPSGSVHNDDEARETGPPAGGLDDGQETTPDVVEDGVAPLVEDTVVPLVVEVVMPLVQVVERQVEEAVDQLVHDVVTPLVDHVEELQVEDTVESLVDDLTGTVDDLTGTVDEVVTGLGGLLGP